MSILKNFKIIALACITSTSLVACSSNTLKSGIEDPVEILTFAKDANVYESIESTVSTNIKSVLNNQPLDININFDSLYSSKQNAGLLNTYIDIGSNQTNSSTYILQENNSQYKYTNYMNEWSKQEISVDEFNNILASFSEPMYFDDLIANGNAFTVEENDTSYILNTDIKIQDIEDTLQYIGVLNMLSTINISLDNINQDNSISLTLEIEKGTGYLKNIVIDVLDIANESVANTIIDLINLPLDSFKLEISEFTLNIALNQHNNVPSIELPEEALDL